MFRIGPNGQVQTSGRQIEIGPSGRPESSEFFLPWLASVLDGGDCPPSATARVVVHVCLLKRVPVWPAHKSIIVLRSNSVPRCLGSIRKSQDRTIGNGATRSEHPGRNPRSLATITQGQVAWSGGGLSLKCHYGQRIWKSFPVQDAAKYKLTSKRSSSVMGLGDGAMAPKPPSAPRSAPRSAPP